VAVFDDFDSADPLQTNSCNEDSFFFVQTPCIIPKDLHFSRMLWGLLPGSLAVFIYLFVVIYIDFIKTVQTNKFVDFDVKTITAGDYTIEFDLDHTQYDKFK